MNMGWMEREKEIVHKYDHNEKLKPTNQFGPGKKSYVLWVRVCANAIHGPIE